MRIATLTFVSSCGCISEEYIKNIILSYDNIILLNQDKMYVYKIDLLSSQQSTSSGN